MLKPARALVSRQIAFAVGAGAFGVGCSGGSDSGTGGATDGAILVDDAYSPPGDVDLSPDSVAPNDSNASESYSPLAETSNDTSSAAADSTGSDARREDAADAVGPDSCASTSYDKMVLCDHPVAFWAMNKPSGTEPDLTGNANTGTYIGGMPTLGAMPNGEQAAVFNGSSEYASVPSNAALSIPTTGNLTWEGWIRPDVLQFPHETGGYVDWMGKCDSYSPTCEWEARMYDTTNPEGRCNRISAYVFNPTAGLGSAADWQPTCGLLKAGQWYHVVGEYTTRSQPADCPKDPAHPGSIDIWINGVEWNQSRHGTTGCMSQYSVVPTANQSTLQIGTLAKDSFFQGAIGKIAIYNYLLTQAQVTNHYVRMTGQQPTGSCSDMCSF